MRKLVFIVPAIAGAVVLATVTRDAGPQASQASSREGRGRPLPDRTGASGSETLGAHLNVGPAVASTFTEGGQGQWP